MDLALPALPRTSRRTTMSRKEAGLSRSTRVRGKVAAVLKMTSLAREAVDEKQETKEEEIFDKRGLSGKSRIKYVLVSVCIGQIRYLECILMSFHTRDRVEVDRALKYPWKMESSKT